MFSITVMRESALVSWNVRTMPALATLPAGSPASERPLKDHSPLSGLSKPVRRLNSVVLPAPLGPIRAVILPRWTSRWSTSTATMPPKARCTPSATRIGSGLRAPGTRSTSENTERVASADIDRQLLLVPEDALRAEDDEHHERHADHDEAERLDLLGAQHGRGDHVTHDGLDEHEARPQEHRAEHGAEHGRGAAEQQEGPDEERRGTAHRVGLDGLGEDEHDAAERPHAATEDERLHLVGVHALAERAHGVLVLTDPLEHASPRRAHEAPHEEAQQCDEHPRDDPQPPAVGVAVGVRPEQDRRVA